MPCFWAKWREAVESSQTLYQGGRWLESLAGTWLWTLGFNQAQDPIEMGPELGLTGGWDAWAHLVLEPWGWICDWLGVQGPQSHTPSLQSTREQGTGLTWELGFQVAGIGPWCRSRW